MSSGDNVVFEMPPMREILQAIEYWRRLDLRRMDPESVHREMSLVRTLIGACVMQTRTSSATTLRRARVREDGDDFAHRSDCWEPPRDLMRVNRCNAAGEPVLYCASNLATALDEVRAEQGKEVLMVEYHARNLRLAHVVGEFEPTNAAGTSCFTPEGLLAYQVIREFLRAEFTKPVCTRESHLYHISNAICQVWRRTEDIDGWIYPSALLPTAENCALVASAAHDKLSIAGAHRGRIEGSGHPSAQVGNNIIVVDGFKVAITHQAEFNGDEIRWNPSPPGSFQMVMRNVLRRT